MSVYQPKAQYLLFSIIIVIFLFICRALCRKHLLPEARLLPRIFIARGLCDRASLTVGFLTDMAAEQKAAGQAFLPILQVACM